MKFCPTFGKRLLQEHFQPACHLLHPSSTSKLCNKLRLVPSRKWFLPDFRDLLEGDLADALAVTRRLELVGPLNKEQDTFG